jgi:hypothetical protein
MKQSVLMSSAQTQHKMEGRFLLDVVIAQRPAVFELLPRKNQALLVRRNAFLILDLRLHILNSVGWLDVKGDGLPCQGLHENLHGR